MIVDTENSICFEKLATEKNKHKKINNQSFIKAKSSFMQGFMALTIQTLKDCRLMQSSKMKSRKQQKQNVIRRMNLQAKKRHPKDSDTNATGDF